MDHSSAVRFPPRLELARLPTPLRQLEHFPSCPEGVRIWIKQDELTGTELSGNKVRKLEFSLAEARRRGCDTLISCGGVQSNHARATAVLGARLGFQVHLILRGEEPDVPDGNLLMNLLAGARISYVPKREYHRHEDIAADLAHTLEKRGRKPFFIPIGGSDETGLWGYIAACQELQQDFLRLGLRPDHIVTATGSGGTQGGLLLGNQLFGLGSRVVAINVSDDAEYFRNKIGRDIERWRQRYGSLVAPDPDPGELEIATLDGHVGPGYGVAEQPVFDLIAELARSEGVFLDPVYTGKAFLGMLEEIRNGRLGAARDVLFIHTGGIFGLFPQRAAFRFS